MSWKHILIACSLSSFISVLLMFSASNGVKDLARMLREMKKTRVHIAQVEQENQELRRKVDVIDTHPDKAIESYIRSELGWVRETEKVYLEQAKTFKRTAP